jgi:tRNA-dihydrouridine synthase A
LAQCAKVAEQWGYDQVNLNCGCPSERVQRGAFGACLMLHPQEVSACVKAMREASDLPVSVKHRIGIDGHEDYEFVRDFVGVVSEAGCQTFIVHARIAVLSGLSPKENREIPPLKYDVVDRLKLDFPELNFVLNGGIQTHEQVMSLLDRFDGVMLGRAAYHQPWLLSHWDACWSQTGSAQSLTGFESLGADDFAARKAVELQYVQYMQRQMRDLDLHWSVMSRHMLGLYHGLAGARRWRQVWSSVQHRPLEPLEVMSLAHEAMAQSKASTLTCTAFEQ